MIEIDLQGKAALITGGARGIGRAAALLLSRAGCDVAVGCRHERGELRDLVVRLREHGSRAVAVAADVATPSGCQRLVDETLAAFGKIDHLIVNAGIWKEAPIESMTPEELEETLAVNLKSAFHLCRAAVGTMKKAASGNIVLISSTAGQRGEAFYSHYAASKAGLIALAKSLAEELGPSGIRVNCVAPGWVLTDMTGEVFGDPAFRRSIRDEIPLRRIAEAEDVAGPILFLVSPLSSHVHGEVLNVNGGSVLCG